MPNTVFNLENKPYTILAYAAIICILATISFGGFTELPFDTHDREIALDYPHLSEDPAFFFSPDKANTSGRILVELVMWGAYAAWGDNPKYFHLLSIVCHVLASLILALACTKLGCSREWSLIAGLLFLLNVAHIQAVYYISGLAYPLTILVVTAATYHYGAYAQNPSRYRLTIFYTLAAASLLFHIAALMLWPFCLYWSIGTGRGWRKTLRELVPLLALFVPVVLIVMETTPTRTSTWETADSLSNQEALPLLGHVLQTLIWFSGRLITNAHWLLLAPHTKPVWEKVIGGLAIVGSLILIWQQRPVAAWVAWTGLFLIPFLFIPEHILQNMPIGPSRYLYFASVGSSVLLAWAAQQLGGWLRGWKPKFGRLLYSVLLGILLGYNCWTLRKTEALASYMSGRHYIASKNLGMGGALLQRAIDHAPEIIDTRDAYSRLGMFYLRNPKHFTDFIGSALEIYPKDTTLNLFSVVYNTIDVKERRMYEKQLQSLCTYDPTYAKDIGMCYYNLGLGLLDAGRMDQAIYAYQRSLEFLPDRVKVMKDLVNALVKQGDTAQLAQLTNLLTQIATLLPNDPEAQYKAMLTLRLQRKPERALEFGRKALALRPSTDLYLQLGNLYGQLSDAQRAVEHYRYVLDREPNIAAQFSLGLALLSLGHSEQARTAYAEGIAQYGADEAERIGAVASLKVLAKSNSQAARDILQTYWP